MQEKDLNEQLCINNSTFRFDTPLYKILVTEREFYISKMSSESKPLEQIEELIKLLQHVQKTINNHKQ